MLIVGPKMPHVPHFKENKNFPQKLGSANIMFIEMRQYW